MTLLPFSRVNVLVLAPAVAACGGDSTSPGPGTSANGPSATAGAGGAGGRMSAGGAGTGGASLGGKAGAPAGGAAGCTGSSCPCVTDADCKKPGADLCKGATHCTAGACVLDPATAVQCPASTTPCVALVCMPATGDCEPDVHALDGTPCDDGAYCTKGDSCSAGACGPGTSSPCSACEACDEATKSCGVALGHCEIDGKCFSAGQAMPSSPCQVCDPGSPSVFTPAAAGTVCGGAAGCSAGATCDGTGACITAPATPKAPALVAPRNGAHTGSVHASTSFATLRPTLSWSSESCADGYDVEIASCVTADCKQTQSISTTHVKATVWQPTTDLPVSTTPPVGARLLWRVRACSGAVCSAWSAGRRLDVGRPRCDVDGDGYSDVVLAAYAYKGSGAVFVFPGSAAGTTTKNPLKVVGAANNPDFGMGHACGDIDGDGFADLVISSPGTFPNRIDLFRGSATGAIGTSSSSFTVQSFAMGGSPYPFENLAVGDFDGDGFDDVVASMSATKWMGGATPGAVVLRGSTGGFASGAKALDMSGDWQGEARFGVGDIDGDGYADLAMGGSPPPAKWAARTFKGSAGGLSGGAAYAPPVDTSDAYSWAVGIAGDGVGGVVVTDPDWLGPGLVSCGRAYSYRATGYVEIPDPTCTSSTFFGRAVTWGDLDRDGFDDLVISDSVAQNLYVYPGTAKGPSVTPKTISSAASGNANFGWLLDATLDVDGDGRSDLFVTAPGDNTTQGYVYLGGPGGVAATPAASFGCPNADFASGCGE